MKNFISIVISPFLWISFWITSLFSICLLLFITLFIPKKLYNLLVRAVCSIIIYSVLIIPKLKTKISHNFPYPVIFVANHVSFFDLFISGNILPGYPRGLELKEHFKKPIYGWFISRFGQIPIDVSSSSSVKNSLNGAVEILSNKTRNIFVMPEGKRTRDGKLGQFRHGAFYLSKKANVPIVPVVYKNLYKLNNPNSLKICPGILGVFLLDPVYPENFQSDEDMSNYVRNLMKNKLEE